MGHPSPNTPPSSSSGRWALPREASHVHSERWDCRPGRVAGVEVRQRTTSSSAGALHFHGLEVCRSRPAVPGAPRARIALFGALAVSFATRARKASRCG